MSVLEKVNSNKVNWKALLISIAVSLGTGVASSLLTGGAMREYGNLYQPPLAPPGWLFPVVWTILYILMGIAAYLVWEAGFPDGGATGGERSDIRTALTLYLIQLLLNALWPVLFFNRQAYFLAFAELLLLWLAIYLTIKQFKEISRAAALLMLPYLAWVTFAAYLNLAIALNAG